MFKFYRFTTAVSATVLILTTARASDSSPKLTAPLASTQPSTTHDQHYNKSQISPNNTASVIIAPKVALANHLKQIGAKFYGTFWCPYCTKQKQMFGEQAFRQINYIECDARGNNPQPNLCIKARISGFPTWEIKGKQYLGMKSLKELADLSGYKGDSNFGN